MFSGILSDVIRMDKRQVRYRGRRGERKRWPVAKCALNRVLTRKHATYNNVCFCNMNMTSRVVQYIAI